jgi:uncharacterized LabA/DUF88 family protein
MNAAVFVDFENLFLSLKNRTDGLGLRTRDLSLQILEGLLSRLREEGTPMVLGRSYAAFDTYPGVEVAHDLALMGLDPQYVLISHSGKNSADIQLALDTARVVFRRADIQLIVIVSGDRDFIPLARQVLEEGRELVVVAIPDTTSGDLRERVGFERFWNALSLVKTPAPSNGAAAPAVEAPAPVKQAEPVPAADIGAVDGPPAEAAAPPAARPPEAPSAERPPVAARPARNGDDGPHIVGHIPVTWKTQRAVAPEEHEERLRHCLELMVRAQIRHGSPEIWLSPFLKGPMSQYFSHMVHPERRGLINELRNRGAIRVEERDNMYADHPYSVIVIQEAHPMAQAARSRVMRNTV